MQLALNLITEDKMKRLLKDSGKDAEEDSEDDENKDEEEEEEAAGSREGNHLELMIKEIEEKKSAGKKPEPEKDNEKTLKQIIKKINERFSKKKGKARKTLSRSDYLKEEFFSRSQYRLKIQNLFDYLDTKSSTDVYKAFYNQAKDKIYNFEDEMLTKEQQEKIVQRTKLARWMGYKGDAVYCSHDQLDAHTREKWELIRNICYVFTLTMLRYETSLS